MVDIGSALAKVIEWILVPLILLLLFGYAFATLPEEPIGSAAKKAARSARWAGLIFFVLFVLWRQGRGDNFLDTMPSYRFDVRLLTITVIAAVAGFASSWFVDWLRSKGAIPFAVIPLVVLTLTASYTYFFIWNLRTLILFLALGFALGALLKRAFGAVRSESTDDQKAN